MTTSLITCLNGQFLPAEDAKLPVSDRGFRFGDGVFETIFIQNGVAYQWNLHLERLHKSLAALRIAAPSVDWQKMVQQLLTKNQTNQGFVRIAVSRGLGSRGYLPQPGIIANWVIEYLPPSPPLDAPCTLWKGSVTRSPLSSLPVNQKLAQGVSSTLALIEAHDHEANEALMQNSDGFLCEAASANLFWMIGSELYTPSLKTGCLGGTTRAAILRLFGKPVHEVIATPDKLEKADAVFITSTRVGVWPVQNVIGLETTLDIAHPPLIRLQKAFIADRESYVEAHREIWTKA